MNWDNLVRVSRAKEHNLPYTSATFYAWYHTKKHPGLFIKHGNSLFIRTDKLAELMLTGKISK